MTSDRLEALEREVAVLRGRLEALEGRTRPAAAPVQKPASPAVVQARRASIDLEELLGGRLLALAGGAAFLLGVAFFVALAIDRGWIGIATRVVLAGIASTALFTGGAWLYERRGRNQAALAMAGAGIAAQFLALTAATAAYGLVPDLLAVAIGIGIGSAATVAAVRWSSRTVAGLGIGGAVLAPILTWSFTTSGVALLAVAFAAATAVLLRQRWAWLAAGAFAIAVSELAIFVLGHNASQLVTVVFVSVFAALNLVAALGHDFRTRTQKLEPASAFLAVFGALALGALGYAALPHGAGELAGGLWLAALALAYAELGVVAIRSPRASDEVALSLFAAGLGLGDVALGLLGHGVALTVVWAAGAGALAVLARRVRKDAEQIQFALGGQLGLAIGHALLFEATPTLLKNGHGGGLAALTAVASIAVGAFTAARLTLDEPREWRVALDTVALVGLAYADALAFHDAALAVAWALAAGALAETARKTRDDVARVGAFGFVALAGLYVLATEAQPSGLVHGSTRLLAGAIGIAVTAAAAIAVGERCCDAKTRRVLRGAAGAGVLYFASIAVVTMMPHQQGQVVVSGLWAVTGVGALWLGLRREERELRLGGFALLILSLAKVVLYDLAALASIYRVLSLVAVGLLLLLGAFAYQRISRHPRALAL